MTSTAPQHDRKTPELSELASEIEQALHELDRSRAAFAEVEPRQEPFPAEQLAVHARGVVLDATLALLIRHRLPIDAAAERAVRDAEHPDHAAWARGCAQHICGVVEARAKNERNRP